MTVLTSTYYGLTRVREQSPDANDWAVTDGNVEMFSKILKAIEQHRHTGTPGPQYPGYYTSPAAATGSVVGPGGSSTYTYYYVAIGPVNQVSDTTTVSSANATLGPTSTNANHLSWSAVTSATSYDVIRLSGGTTQGLIGNTTSLFFDDTGQVATPYTPVGSPDIINSSTVGILAPGTSIGIRLAYENASGLETQASPERIYVLADEGIPPLAPGAPSGSIVTLSPGIPGGNYFYVMTKVKGSGETLISEVTNVALPYDRTSGITLTFDPFSTYTDGTDSLKIYRSNGFNESFQLVKTITGSTTASYQDNNVIEDANAQPPTTSTFGANKSIQISWASITHPSSVTGLKVYVTQQSGIWTTNHLLTTVPIVASVPTTTSITYLGNESLDSGTPKESTQIPDGAPVLNIGVDTLIPYYVHSYPTGIITDGTTIFYEFTNSGAGKVVWTLRYDSASSRWYCVGGGPLTSISSSQMFVENGSNSTASPTLTLPRPGKYTVTFGSQQAWTSSGSGALLKMTLFTQNPSTGAPATQVSLRAAWGRSDTTDMFESLAATDSVVLTDIYTLILQWTGTNFQCRAEGNYISVIPVYLT